MATAATYYGANYTVVDNSPAVASLVNATEWGGNVQVLTDTFTAGAADTGTAGSVIYIGKLPKNSIPICTIVSSPAKLTWAGTVGWAGDTDALGDWPADEILVAGSTICGPAAATANTKTTQAQDVFITTTVDALVSSDSISVSVMYVNGG